MAPSCRSPVASRPTPDLPAEVWLMILNEVERGKELYSCSQSSRLFNQLLEPDKQYWCFDLLLPLLLPHLQLQDALNCRLICRDWQNSLDTLLQDLNRPCSEDNDRDRHPLHVATSNPDMRKLVAPIRLTHDLVTRAMIINLQRRFEGCRIVGGALHLGLNGHIGHQPGDYWGSIWIFLRSSFGPRIVSVCLDFSGYFLSTANEIYMLTRVILQNCPNLRKLHCKEYLEEMQEISAMILESSPLPEMTHLESLALEGICDDRLVDESLPLIHPLLDKYALQLKWLELVLYPDVTLQKLGNLTELSVSLPDLMQDAAVDHVRRLLAIPSQHLQRLVLGLDANVHLFLQTLLDLCDQFPLRLLCVHGKVDTRLLGMLGEVRLRRNLKSLIFMDVVGVDSFNFLECFPSLEHLHLRGTYLTMTDVNQNPRNLPKPQYGVRSRTTPETVQIRQFLYPDTEQQMDDMYQSNLWTICPRLKTFVFEYSWVGYRFWLNQNNQNNQQNQFINVDPDENRPRVYTRQGLWRQSGF